MSQTSQSSPPQTAPGCMCCHHQRSRRFLLGCCWCWKSLSAIAVRGSFAWCLWGSEGLACHPEAYSSWASLRWGGCSLAQFRAEAAWREASSSASPPPGSSAGWQHGGKCLPVASVPPSALADCTWGWWCGWWAAHQTRVEASCTRTLSSPPPQCPYLRHSIPWSPAHGFPSPFCPQLHQLQIWG